MNSATMKDLRGITAASVEKYLTFTGWSRNLDFPNHKIMLFINNQDPDFKLAIPADENSKDYYPRVYDAIILLSDVQSKSIDEILESIRTIYTDRIQFRIITESTQNGKIPLSYAAQCVEGLKDLVLYAACAEEHAHPICMRAGLSAKSRLDKFEFAQTEYGSFVFNVDVPVVDEENEQSRISGMAASLPVAPEHKIVTRIQTAISQVDNVVNQDVHVGDLVRDAYEQGITANMCDALYRLKPEGVEDVEVETTFRYADAITMSAQAPIKRKLGNVHFSIVDEISKRYKDRTLVEDVSLQGIIKMLSKERSEEGDYENTVKLLARIDNKMHSIKVHLSAPDHALACDAYRDDKEVIIEGIIDKSQKNWFFTEVTKFSVVE